MEVIKEKSRLAVGVSVLITAGYNILLGERINNTAAGMYSTPGGRIELDEDMFTCAIRETAEETGLTLPRSALQVLEFKEHFRFGGHYIMFYIHAQDFIGVVKNLEPEKCIEWKWFPLDDIPENCTEPKEVIAKLINGLKDDTPKS